jgi:hypothetical protein
MTGKNKNMKNIFARRPFRASRPLLTVAACCGAALLLSACGSDVKKQLGMGRNSPDEFMVVKRAPLTLPPDYNLRPPGASAAPPASDASNRAKAALLGKQTLPADIGGAEKELMTRMGVQQANPDIRSLIDKENGYIALKNKPVVDKLIFWRDDATRADQHLGSSIVDAKAEAERLKKNQAEGKPVNAGDVPVIEKKQSTIDKIF